MVRLEPGTRYIDILLLMMAKINSSITSRGVWLIFFIFKYVFHPGDGRGIPF